MYLIPPNKRSSFYQVAYKKNDRWTTRSTGEKLKSDALRFLTELNQKLSEKKLPSIPDITLKEFSDEYLTRVKIAHSKKYVQSIEYAFLKLSDNLGKNILLKAIDHRIIENFLYTTYSRSSSLAFQFYRTLKAAFSKAISWEYIQVNPFDKVKLPRGIEKFPVFLSAEEIQKIINKTETKILKDIFIMAFLTGLRRAELLNLTWNNVDLKNGIITVRNTSNFTTKSKRERIIPINQTVKGILKKRFPKIIDISLSDFVFCRSRGVKFNDEYISQRFKRAVRAAGLNDGIHFHSLRHSFASMLVQKGVPLYVIKELLGHKDLKATQIYSHLAAENLFDAIKVLNTISKIG